jgi:hypothetical protein
MAWPFHSTPERYSFHPTDPFRLSSYPSYYAFHPLFSPTSYILIPTFILQSILPVHLSHTFFLQTYPPTNPSILATVSFLTYLRIVSDYRLDDRSSIPGRGKGFFLYPLRPDRQWGPPSFLSSWYRWSFPGRVGSKARPESNTDHSLPSSAEIKNE